ncbi:ArgP/LysG family DNA-binding transcriptional regulator [Pseudoalteromonas sp. NBT06-2]|uniref:LysR family transcriptional regulator ArgP n=1 Tax=Pseudoalteromonas sp. NBT06-2 TaxID=2025950 RepID=UPI000BA69AB0|nr:LysR family transcriptional regulator ArgP [Pseudoalteromonas sp. NBT06-2]PAJ75446.1 ArgP/LysG family DNA-binding transcriptional regulator [Pseudoalteromonas sp. NBT06-2]
MNHLDYKLLYALSIVIKQQSFEKAADVLCITQPAVSQRIKQLEQLVAQPVLIRSQPIVATELGKKLLSHYQQVQQLEAELLPQIILDQPESTLTVNLATNADSLATWLIGALTPLINQHPIELNLIVADESRTLDKLKDGEVFGAISLNDKAVSGCEVTQLGTMEYILVASPEFKQKYFTNGINQQSLKYAPGAAFDQKDDMHIKFIEQHFDLKGGSYPCHTVRSSEAFVELVKQGAAYSLIPKLQIKNELVSGDIINILPNIKLTQTLYWHRWVLVKGVYKQISEAIMLTGKTILNS